MNSGRGSFCQRTVGVREELSTPSYSSSQQISNTYFSSNKEPSRLLITNPVGSQVAGNFIKQNSPGSFNRGAQKAKTALSLWPNSKAQLQNNLPHSRLSITHSVALLFSVSTAVYHRVTLESESSLDGAGLGRKHHHTHCHFHAIHFYSTLWLQIMFMNMVLLILILTL